MMHIASGVNVLPLVLEIKRQPWLWNKYPIRKDYQGSPHVGLDDIWVRYNDITNFDKEGGNKGFSDEHDSVWYDAYYALPSIKPIIFDLMKAVNGERLGGVLITRIPPGAMCKPHVDTGWHAEYYDKYAVQLEGNASQAFHFEGESFSANPADVYWFDNTKLHWVTNDSDQFGKVMVIKNGAVVGIGAPETVLTGEMIREAFDVSIEVRKAEHGMYITHEKWF